MRRFARVALATTVLATPTAAWASPQDVFGYGSRSTAMGATGAAIGEGAETTYQNPALLSLGRSRELTLGFQGANLSLHADPIGKIPVSSAKGTLIGAQLPLPFKGRFENRVALGLAFYTPTDVVVRGRVLYPDTPQFATLADRLQSVAIQLGLGADLGYGLRVGAGFSALAAISGTVVVATDTSGSVGTRVDDQLVATYGKIVGASLDLGKHYRVGVTYRSELQARFRVVIEVNDLGQLVVPPFNIAGLAQYDPWQVQAEVARVAGPFRVAVGATFKRWSAYPGAPEPTTTCPPDKPECLALKVTPPDYHDTIVPRVGAEKELFRADSVVLRLRAGWFYEPSPAPAQHREANGYDNSRHVITLGYGVELRRPLVPMRVDFFAQWHQLVPRTHEKDADVPQDNPAPRKVETTGRVLMGGLAATVLF